MLPINPLPSFKGARPLLMLGLAAGATALAIWARRRVGAPAIAVARRTRVEPAEQLATPLEVPWGVEGQCGVLARDD